MPACLPSDFFALLLVASVLQAASWIPSAIHAIAARSRQIILAGLAGRLARNLHAVSSEEEDDVLYVAPGVGDNIRQRIVYLVETDNSAVARHVEDVGN